MQIDICIAIDFMYFMNEHMNYCYTIKNLTNTLAMQNNYRIDNKHSWLTSAFDYVFSIFKLFFSAN
jgi:hypothetical protein